jgi:hypothetical protein
MTWFEAANNPTVKALMDAFPGATITVRDRPARHRVQVSDDGSLDACIYCGAAESELDEFPTCDLYRASKEPPPMQHNPLLGPPPAAPAPAPQPACWPMPTVPPVQPTPLQMDAPSPPVVMHDGRPFVLRSVTTETIPGTSPVPPIMDFTPARAKYAPFAEAFQAHIDEAMETHNQEQPQRTYLGGSRLGEECARKLGYEFRHTPKDEGRNFKGKTLRIFDMGHDGETRMASYLRLAGFKLLTEAANGKQFGFYVANDPETGLPRIAGHLDGVIIDGPRDIVPAYPALWENKALNNKGHNELMKQGLKKTKPVYYAQMQTYMAHLDLAANPGLFTSLNRETGELYAELVPFDPAAAQEAIDRGVRVITAQQADDLPRIAGSADDFRCKFCDYQDRCWERNKPAPVATAPAGFGWPTS